MGKNRDFSLCPYKKEEWYTFKVPKFLKPLIDEIGIEIGEKTKWRIVNYVLENHHSIKKLKRSKEYIDLVNTGRLSEANKFVEEFDELKKDVAKILEILESNKDGR